MAISQYYADYGTGNDYKGATFTDGAYTSATKTLTKAGAFAATKVNHWLYLESNDGGSIVAGYYKVTDISGAPNAVILATDAGAGVDDDAAKCTQHDGTTSLPWRSVQGALDLITRNATDGDQVNIDDSAAQVLAASLTLATYGAPTGTIPLVLRGYTSAANDGGRAEIDCNGVTMFAAATYCVGLVDLEIHSFGNANGVDVTEYSTVYRCEIHKGASTPSGKPLVRLNNGNSSVIGCHIHDAGTSGYGVYSTTGADFIIGNHIATCPHCVRIESNPNGSSIIGNIILPGATGSYGISSNGAANYLVIGNIIYNSAAGTVSGVQVSASRYGTVILNNIISGFSGAGGEGIDIAANAGLSVAGYNAFYNNTANITYGDTINHVDLTAGDVALGANPFTDAANGDFSLTDVAKAALRSLGWPASYLGVHANTDPHVTIGPLQYGPTPAAAGGGFPILGGSVVS